MGLQITASKTALFLGCQRPFDPNTEITKEEEVGEPARYGSAFHECLEALVKNDLRREKASAKKWGLPIDSIEELRAHVDAAFKVLKNWLNGDNPFGVTFIVSATEKHLATRLKKTPIEYHVKSRECDFDEETHHYDLRENELLGGTYDLLVEEMEVLEPIEDFQARRAVIDYKTGDWGDFARPSRLPQMRTLALQTGASIVAILHAPRGLPASIYADEITPEDCNTHIKDLIRAKRRIGDGSLRPGPHCKYCPAKDTCPARDGELLERSEALVSRVTQAMGVPVVDASAPLANVPDLGRFHMMIGDMEKVLKRAREELKGRVEAGELVERPDGKCLVIEEKEYETLSKSSITEALGKREGEKLIDSLRKKGVLNKSTRRELHARSSR